MNKPRLPKFIIMKNGKMKISYCVLHKNMAGNDEKNQNVLGGGYWEMSNDFTEITFYGTSTDFGILTEKQIINSINSDNKLPHGLMICERVYHTFCEDSLQKALSNRKLIYTFN